MKFQKLYSGEIEEKRPYQFGVCLFLLKFHTKQNVPATEFNLNDN